MPDGWMTSFSDPGFRAVVVGGSAISALAFLVFALPLTWIAWKAPAWAEPWRIQSKRADLARWFWPSMRWWLINNVALTALIAVTWPLWGRWSTIRLGGWPSPWELALQLVLFVYLDDALYYVMHRVAHQPWAYRHVHAFHHRVVTPAAITGHYMHPVEFVATGLLMLVGPLLVGAHIVTLYAWIVLRQWEASEGHGGLQLPVTPTAIFPGSHGARFHDAHHARFVGNYAGFLGWLDGALGTRVKGYRARESGRLSDS